MSAFTTAMGQLRHAQKTSSGAAAYSRFINRPLGRPLAAAAAVARLTPTQVTLCSAVCTFTAIVLIAAVHPSPALSIVIALLLVLGYALDSADGQLARLTGTGSLAGEWLDHFFDALKTATIHLAVFVSFVRFTDLPPIALAVPLLYAAAASTFFFGITSADFLRRIARLRSPEEVTTPAEASYRTNPLYSLAVLPTDYGLLCIVMALLWLQPAFAIVYAVMCIATMGALLLAAVKWFVTIARLEHRP